MMKKNYLHKFILTLLVVFVCTYTVPAVESLLSTKPSLTVGNVYAQTTAPSQQSWPSWFYDWVERGGCAEGEFYSLWDRECKPLSEKFLGSSSIFNYKYWTSGAFLISIAGYILAFAGWLLNGSISFFILDMGTQLRGQIGTSIVESWTIIRDIINLTFVFGLIYVGFMTVLRGSTQILKHAVPKIIMYAILINFSLFFAKVIVDFSNVTALAIYNNMIKLPTTTGTDSINVGISGFFMDRLGLLHLFDTAAITKGGQASLALVGNDFGIGFSLVISILILVAAFVFIAGAILIAIRFVTIVLLLILSPIAFASGFIPQMNTEEWSRSWWKNMISQAIFAPAYLLLIWIAMNVASSDTFKGAGEITSLFLGGNGQSITALVNIITIIGFLIAALIIAKKAGAYGADTATKWGARATFGLTAAFGRNTFGRLGHRYANDEKLRDKAAEKGIRGFIARRQLGLARTAQSASFDARSIGAVNSVGGLNLGGAQTGGYEGRVKATKEREEAYAKSLGTIKDDDPAVVAMQRQVDDLEGKKKTEREDTAKKKDAQKRTFEAFKAAEKQKADIAVSELTRQKEQKQRAAEDAKKVVHASSASDTEKLKKINEINKNLSDQEAIIDGKVAKIRADQQAAIETKTIEHDNEMQKIEHNLEAKNEELDKDLKTAKDSLEQEKHRRQVGSAVRGDEKARTDYAHHASAIKTQKDALKAASREYYEATTSAGRVTAEANIKAAQNAIKEAEKAQKKIIAEARGKSGVAQGYVAALEADSATFSDGKVKALYAMASSAAQGRNRAISSEAAKVVRASYKTKESTDKKSSKPSAGHAAPKSGGGGASGGHHP